LIDYRKDLNPEQFRAVTAGGGPILVIAGAGSGKTRTLTYRVAYLVESGIRPENILLATFTNKAAKEMTCRVETLIGMEMGRLWAGTFHHIAHLILRRFASRVGLERRFGIMDEEDAAHLLGTISRSLGDLPDEFPRGNVIREIFSLGVNTQTDVEAVVAFRYPYFTDCLDKLLEIKSLYRDRKMEMNLVDFDDLIFYCVELFRSCPDVLKELAGALRYVLVDEYQDTTALQNEFIDHLASSHRNLMVVGDDAQSIYSFRGADFGHIMEFDRKYPDAAIYKLETNYRSTPEILDLANRSIANNERQFFKELKSIRGPGARPALVPLRTSVQQAEFVAQRLGEFVLSGSAPGEIAVLYRAHFHSMELQMELTRRGIPFEIRSGIRFFEQAHVKDAVSFLRIAANPRDENAWMRSLSLFGKVGKKTAEKAWKKVSEKEDPLDVLMSDEFLKDMPKAARAGLEEFRKIMRGVTEDGLDGFPAVLLERVIDEGYGDHLRSRFPDAQSRADDLSQLSRYAAQFRTLHDFLGELALFTSAAEIDRAQGRERPEDRVVLSTIHQAKGLEWSVVFLIGCAEGMFPLARALKEDGGEEEERRLFYVAATRAKDELYICYPSMVFRRGLGGTYMGPSRFIEEIRWGCSDREKSPFELWQISNF